MRDEHLLQNAIVKIMMNNEFKDSKTASILATQIMPAAICDRVDASGLMARGNSDIEMIILAHLAEGNVSFCHHLASVVCQLFTY